MNIKSVDRRLAGSAALFLALVLFAALGYWYDASRSNPVQPGQAATLNVTTQLRTLG